MHKKTFLFILLLFLPFNFVYSETIKLKSGKTIEAKIIEKTDDFIRVDINGTPITYYFSDIESIDGKFVFVVHDGKPSASISRTSKDIFADISPAIVYILNKTIAGEETLGSGFIINKEGIIVTNFHVTKDAKELSVKLKNGQMYPVVGIVYYDSGLDICILKINTTNLPTISMGDSSSLQIGETVYCIGNPLGLEYSFSNGILSAIRELNSVKYLQFTAPVSPGNSGGPLINPQGQAVGIVTFLMEGGQNLNFAIAIDEIKPFISNQIKMTFQDFIEKVSQADYYFAEGNRYSIQGDYNQAIEYYQKVILINPNHAETYTNLGSIYENLGQHQQAISYLQKAIQLDPNLPDAYNNLGVACASLGQYQQAIEYYQKAIQLDQFFAIAYKNLGTLYVKLEQFQQAVEYCQKAIQLDPNYEEAYFYLSNAYLGLGQYQQVIEYSQKAIQLDQNNSYAYNLLGMAYYSLSRYQEAKENLLKAKELAQNQKDDISLSVAEEYLKKLP